MKHKELIAIKLQELVSKKHMLMYDNSFNEIYKMLEINALKKQIKLLEWILEN